MFDRFTDRSRMVMNFAREEALEFRHDYIGTEHILLGLLREGSGVAADVIRERGIDPREVRERIEKLVARGETAVTLSQLPFTTRAKRLLELSLEEAMGLGHNYIGTEHLLLGLIRVPEAAAAQVLSELCLQEAEVREQIRSMVGGGVGNAETHRGIQFGSTRGLKELEEIRRRLTELEEQVRKLTERLGEND